MFHIFGWMSKEAGMEWKTWFVLKFFPPRWHQWLYPGLFSSTYLVQKPSQSAKKIGPKTVFLGRKTPFLQNSVNGGVPLLLTKSVTGVSQCFPQMAKLREIPLSKALVMHIHGAPHPNSSTIPVLLILEINCFTCLYAQPQPWAPDLFFPGMAPGALHLVCCCLGPCASLPACSANFPPILFFAHSTFQ